MLALSSDLAAALARAKPRVVLLVDVGGLTNGKFVTGKRRLFGYPANIAAIDARNTAVNPLTFQQSLGQITVSFIDDKQVRALIAANALIGKTLTVKLGVDEGDDASGNPLIPEASFANFVTAIISDTPAEAGLVKLVAKDVRRVYHAVPHVIVGGGLTGAVTQINAQDGSSGIPQTYQGTGAATLAMEALFTAVHIPSSFIDTASFSLASNDAVRHIVVNRSRAPSDTSVPATQDQSLFASSPVVAQADAIAAMLRGYLRVLEDGAIRFALFDDAASTVDRFTKDDILVGSFVSNVSIDKLVTSVIVRTLFAQTDGQGTANFEITVRGDQATEQTTWGFTDGTGRPADVTIEDKWFTAPVFSPTAIGKTDTTLTIDGVNFAGSSLASPAPGAVDASHPGYLYLREYDTSVGPPHPQSAIEIIEYTSLAAVAGYPNRWTVGGLTRGALGTSAVRHDVATSGSASVATLYDVTAAVRAIKTILGRFKDAPGEIALKTTLAKYAVQLGDFVNVEHPAYVNFGADGLAVGNTKKFEVIEKDVNWHEREITWRLLEVTGAAASPSWATNGNLGSRFGAPTEYHPPVRHIGALTAQDGGTALGTLADAVLEGTAPSTSASLTTTVQEHRAFARGGVVHLASEAHTFTASKDTYVDLVPLPAGASFYKYSEVNNGDAAPSLDTGALRLYKVVTDASTVASVTNLYNTALVDGAKNIIASSIGTGILADGSVTNAKVAVAAAIDGSKLAAGSGPLTHVDSSGVLDDVRNIATRDLDGITDGTSFKRVQGVSAGNQVQAASVANQAITPAHISTKIAIANNMVPNANFSDFGAVGGATKGPPDGWAITSGTWIATDLYADGTTVLSGVYSLHFDLVLGRGTSPEIVSNAWPVVGGRTYVYGAEALHDSGTSNGNLVLYVDWLDASQSLISSTTGHTLGGGTVATFNRVDLTDAAPSAARFARLRLTGTDPTSTADMNFFVDYVWFYDAGDVGTSFPVTPYTNQRYFRTDLAREYFYDGTRWLSMTEFEIALPRSATLFPTSTTPVDAGQSAIPFTSFGGQVYFTFVTHAILVSGTSNGTNYWTIELETDVAGSITNLHTIDTSTMTGSTWYYEPLAVNMAVTLPSVNAAVPLLQTLATKTGTPGTLTCQTLVRYRLIG